LQGQLIKAQLGVRELSGNNDGRAIDLYRASVAKWLNTIKPKPAWCACFYHFLFWAIDINVKKSARARDYFSKKLGSYNPSLHPERPPKFGWAVGYRFKNNQIRHIGYVYEWNPDPNVPMCRILEGNTSNKGVMGIVVRDGDGVYIKTRAKTSIAMCTPINNLKTNGSK
jgi:hypothetical protein